MNAQHTPTPWVVEADKSIVMIVAEEGGMPGVLVSQGVPTKQDKVNADFIVLACNSYNTLVQQRDELVGVLEAVDAWVATRKGVVMPYALETMARAALSRIKGES